MTDRQYNICVDLFSDRLFRFALKNLKDTFAAEDVVQNTFEILWKKHTDVDFAKAKAYLFKVAYHNMIDQIRKNKRYIELPDFEVNEEKILHTEEYTGIKEMIDKAVNQLSADQRSVIILRDYEGYSYQEISEITGLTPEQVKVYIFRGRKFLKNYIQQLEKTI